MKQIITTLVIAAWLAGCAQNQINQSTETANQVSTDSFPALEKQCKYERSTSAGPRLQRVCRYVAPAESADSEK